MTFFFNAEPGLNLYILLGSGQALLPVPVRFVNEVEIQFLN